MFIGNDFKFYPIILLGIYPCVASGITFPGEHKFLWLAQPVIKRESSIAMQVLVRNISLAFNIRFSINPTDGAHPGSSAAILLIYFFRVSFSFFKRVMSVSIF